MRRTSFHLHDEAQAADLYAKGEALLPEVQNALAALADVEARYEIERERLARWSGPRPVKDRLGALLAERYRAERAQCAELLDELQRRLLALREPRVLH